MEREKAFPEVENDDVVIDPYFPTGSSGTRDFWVRYKKLADEKDDELAERLNRNLDVLLIFAGLFSGVNTAFVSLTAASLSPDPMDRTNSLLETIILRESNNTISLSDISVSRFSPTRVVVTSNCLLYASLCFSLMAAMGAMLGKEWLQGFSRRESQATVEQQSRIRQLKLDGVQRWHLESTILVLPTLILFSVLLFFVGISLYLIGQNWAVASLVILLASLGFIVVGLTIIAGAVFPFCPYQTSGSRGLSRTMRSLHQLKIGISSDIRSQRLIQALVLGFRALVPKVQALTDRMTMPCRTNTSQNNNSDSQSNTRIPEPLSNDPDPDTMVSAIGSGGPDSVMVPSGVEWESGDYSDDHKVQVQAQASRWFLKASSSGEDQLAVAQYICSLDATTPKTYILQDPIAWKRLLTSTQAAILEWGERPSVATQEKAEALGATLCHILLLVPRCDKEWSEVRNAIHETAYQHSSGRRLEALGTMLTAQTDKERESYKKLINAGLNLRKAILRRVVREKVFREPLGPRESLALWLRLPRDGILLSLFALYVCRLPDSNWNQDGEPLRRSWEEKRADARAKKRAVAQAIASDEVLSKNFLTNAMDALLALERIASSIGGWKGNMGLLEVCNLYLHQIKAPVAEQSVSETLTSQLIQWIQKALSTITRRKSHDTVTYAFFVKEIVALSVLLRMREPEVEVARWRAIDNLAGHAVEKPDVSAELLLDAFLMDTIKWTVGNRKSPVKFNELPNLVAFTSSRFQRFFEPISDTLMSTMVSDTSPESAEAWINAGLGLFVVRKLAETSPSQEAMAWLSFIADVWDSPLWVSHFIENGIVQALGKLTLELESETSRWTPVHGLVAGLLTDVWNNDRSGSRETVAVEIPVASLRALALCAQNDLNRTTAFLVTSCGGLEEVIESLNKFAEELEMRNLAREREKSVREGRDCCLLSSLSRRGMIM